MQLSKAVAWSTGSEVLLNFSLDIQIAKEIASDWMANDNGLLSTLGSESCPNQTFFNCCNSRMTFSSSAFVAWSAELAYDFLLQLFVDDGSLAPLDLSVEEYCGFQDPEDA